MKKLLLLLCMCFALCGCSEVSTQSNLKPSDSLEAITYTEASTHSFTIEVTERETLQIVTVTPKTTKSTQETSKATQNTTKETQPVNQGGKIIIVYWTLPNGKVYHSTNKCYHLARSKNIYSGTIEEALKAGMLRPCEHCW